MRIGLQHFSSLILLILFISSCAVSQPRTETGTENRKAFGYFNEALGYYNMMDLEQALEKIDRALRKDDEFIDAYMLKGDILKTMKRFEESEQAFLKVLEIKPDFTTVYLYLGESQFEAQHYASSAQSLEKFIAGGGSDRQLKDAKHLLASAEFAAEAIKNPVPFEPKNCGDNINSEYSEYFPGITADGEYFIFTRKIKNSGYPHEDFFICKKVNDTTWGEAYNLGSPVNTQANEGSVSISTDGQFIFFASCDRSRKSTLQGQREGRSPQRVYNGCDLYYSRLNGDQWSIPRHLGNVVNSRGWESTPTLSFDGLSLYFSSTREGGYGGSDIWVSHFDGKQFLEPVNLGPDINTEYNEQTPFIHPDDQTLYFSSNGWPGMGGYDFFLSRRNDSGRFDKPINLGYPINTISDEKGLLVNSQGSLAYFSSDSRPDSKGGVDLYQFELYTDMRPKQLSYVKAIVVDDKTGQPLEAQATLLNLKSGDEVLTTSTNSATGSFLIVLQGNTDYALHVNKEGYMFHSENFSLTRSEKNEPYTLEVRLKKIEIQKPVVLNNVFFDVNSYELRPESEVELKRMVKWLSEQENVKIQISGHTDNTGNADANNTLSKNRAKAVFDYLVEQGISADRLTYKGYGASKPIAENSTEEGRQKNRRTEYQVTGM